MSLRMLHFQNETNASCPDLRGQGYRASFHTHSAAKGPRKKIYHGHLEGSGPRKGEHAVVKVFRDGPGTEAMCDAEIDKHRLATKLARRFNKMVADPRAKISFTLPLKSTVESLAVGQYLTRHRRGRHLDKMEWVLIEENLVRQGEYQVFIGKAGETLDKSPTALDAFLHFTYHESDRKFVLSGFQGVRTDKGYILTTPCIHSEDSSFGHATDGGPKMMRKVFEQHVCNNLCYSYERPPPLTTPSEWKPLRRTKQIRTAKEEEDHHHDDDDEEEDLTDQSWFCIPEPENHQRTASGESLDHQRPSFASSSGDENTFEENCSSASELTDMMETGVYSDGDSAGDFSHKVFSLGKEETTEDLAYCSTDLSKSVLEEIEEEQRKAEERRAEDENSGKQSERDFFRRIHLGDQLKTETGERRTVTDGQINMCEIDEPLHRCNVQAVGGIEKRPSI